MTFSRKIILLAAVTLDPCITVAPLIGEAQITGESGGVGNGSNVGRLRKCWTGIQALHARTLRFSRSESRQRVLAYLQGLLEVGSAVGRNAGDATPWWRAVAGGVPLGREEALPAKGAFGRKWILKQGQKYPVQRHGGEGGENGVFLAWPSRRGLLDRELSTPAMGGGLGAAAGKGVAFRTKAQLALGRAVAAGVPFAWVTGDTVYGNDRRLRRWLEEQGRCYVLAVKNNEPLWADTERGSAQVAARRLAEEIPDDDTDQRQGKTHTGSMGGSFEPPFSLLDGLHERQSVRLWVGTGTSPYYAFLAVTRSYAAGDDGKRGIQ